MLLLLLYCVVVAAVFAVAVLADLQPMSILGQSKQFALSEASIVNRIFGSVKEKNITSCWYPVAVLWNWTNDTIHSNKKYIIEYSMSYRLIYI